MQHKQEDTIHEPELPGVRTLGTDSESQPKRSFSFGGITFTTPEKTDAHTESKVDEHTTAHDKKLFDVARAFNDEEIQEGTIVTDKKRTRMSTGAMLKSAWNEWWGKTQKTVSKKVQQIEVLKERAEQKVEAPEQRTNIIQEAAKLANQAPRDDHAVVVDKVRTFARDASVVSGKAYSIKESPTKPGGWMHTETPAPRDLNAREEKKDSSVTPVSQPPLRTEKSTHTVLAEETSPKKPAISIASYAPLAPATKLTSQTPVTHTQNPVTLTPKGAVNSSQPAPQASWTHRTPPQETVVDARPNNAALVSAPQPTEMKSSTVNTTPLPTRETALTPTANVPTHTNTPRPSPEVESIKRSIPPSVHTAQFVPPTQPVTPSTPPSPHAYTPTPVVRENKPTPSPLPQTPVHAHSTARSPEQAHVTTSPVRIESPEEPKIPLPQVHQATLKPRGVLSAKPAQHLSPLVLYGGVVTFAVVLGVGAALFIASMATPSDTSSPSTPQAQTATPQTLLRADTHVSIPLPETRDELFKAITDAISTGTGEVIHVYPSVNAGEIPLVADTDTIMLTLSPRAPGAFLRTLSDTTMFGGVQIGTTREPFIVFQSANFDVTFAGMLEWESTMSEDLAPLFGAPFTARPFTDALRGNDTIRILKDDTGAEHLVYAYINSRLIIITTSTDALSALITRIR